MKRNLVNFFALILIFGFSDPLLAAQETETDTEHFAKQLQNPVANLISVPMQNNWNSELGTNKNGNQYLFKLQPVIPFSYNRDYNLIVRPIFSYINQQDVTASGAKQAGLSDTQLELFWSPKAVGSNGLIWGLGTVILLPTAAQADLGTEKWGIGPAAVVLKQAGPWTYGALVNQLWSVAGNTNRNNISAIFMEPFIAHSNKHGTTLNLLSETTYDWLNNQWTIPLEAGVSQILPIAGHYVSFGLTALYNLQSPTNISKWGSRFTITLLLPNKEK